MRITLGVIISLFIIVGACASGCTTRHGARSIDEAAAVPAADPAKLQSELMDFADGYVTVMSDVYDSLGEEASTAAAKRAALERKIDTARGSLINATNPNPVAGLMDTLVLVSLQNQACEETWFMEMFPASGERARATLTRENAQAWEIASRYLSKQHLGELRAAIKHWRAQHPEQRSFSLVRLSDFPEARQAQVDPNHSAGSIFSLLFIDPLANLSPAVRELESSRIAANRMFFFVQRMPDMLRWQLELLYGDMMANPQITGVVGSTTRFADVSQNFAASTARLPKDLGNEGDRLVAQLQAVIAKQLDQSVRQVADATNAERTATLKQVDEILNRSRDDAVKQLAATIRNEREESLKQTADVLRAEHESFVNYAESASNRLVDRVTWRCVIGAAMVTLIVLLAAMLYRRGGSRRTSASIVAPAPAATGD